MSSLVVARPIGLIVRSIPNILRQPTNSGIAQQIYHLSPAKGKQFSLAHKLFNNTKTDKINIGWIEMHWGWCSKQHTSILTYRVLQSFEYIVKSLYKINILTMLIWQIPLQHRAWNYSWTVCLATFSYVVPFSSCCTITLTFYQSNQVLLAQK